MSFVHVSPGRAARGYILLLIAAIAGFFAIRWYGESIVRQQSTSVSEQVAVSERAAATASEASSPPNATADQSAGSKTQKPVRKHVIASVLTALVVVIATARLVGVVFQWIGQPRVIGEVVAGILLGPSLLGRISPSLMTSLFPDDIMPQLGVLAQLGVILYMFLVGLELNSELLRARASSTVMISHASIVVPFLLGSLIALLLFRDFSPDGVSFTSFSLFLGAAMAITAFPVLARILTDRKMAQSELGVIALGCAAADDVTAWCLLALVVGVTQSAMSSAVITVVLSVLYIGLMIMVIRPMVIRWLARTGDSRPSRDVTAWVLVAVLTSSLFTELIGIHAIFGAFLLGAMIPHQSEIARAFRQKLEDVVTILLLPAFFAYTGLRTQIGLLNETDHWIYCGLIIIVATLGKFGGTFVAAKATGLDSRTSAALGILMNTRGLMELIVLNIGLDLGVISPTLFAMMVLMALVTTTMTTPVLSMIGAGERDNAEPVMQK